MRRRGFTLVEVVVALVVLEIGLLGVMGTMVLAARTLRRAERVEDGVTAVERTLDSLVLSGGAGQGRKAVPGGVLEWRAVAGGVVHVVFSTPTDSALVVVDGGVGGSP